MDTERLLRQFTTGSTEGNSSSREKLLDELAEAILSKIEQQIKAGSKNPLADIAGKVKPASVFFLFDRSGSMSSRLSDAQGGYDTFISEQAKVPGTKICLWDFDQEHRLVYPLTNADEIPLKDEKDAYKLVPRGGTALLDAITRIIAYAEENKKDGDVVQVVILTDGLENSSHEATSSSVKALIEKKQSEGWVFVYLGANQDAITEAAKIGIPVAMAANFDMSNVTTASAGTASMLSLGRSGKTYGYSDTQRKKFVTDGNWTTVGSSAVGSSKEPDTFRYFMK